jgi:hypothetical protein
MPKTIDWGMRANKSKKGPGFLGTWGRPNGGISTELSVGVTLDGKEMEIPTMVPTLSRDEIDYLLSGAKPTREIIDKAVEHAKKRMKEGKSPFKEWDEVQGPGPEKQSWGND